MCPLATNVNLIHLNSLVIKLHGASVTIRSYAVTMMTNPGLTKTTNMAKKLQNTWTFQKASLVMKVEWHKFCEACKFVWAVHIQKNCNNKRYKNNSNISDSYLL